MIFQSSHFFTNLYTFLVGRICNIYDIGALRGNATNEIIANGKLLGRLSIHLPSDIVANSKSAISTAKNLGINKSKLHFLPNVVDCQLFKPIKRNSSRLRLLWVGRFEKEKQPEHFINLIDQLHKNKFKSIEGWMIGDGSLRQDMEDHATFLGLTPNHIRFLGNLNNIETIYNKTDLLILTSAHEGTPNVILEAMASGLPVISSSVGGIPDIIYPNLTGLLYNPTDQNDLLNKTINILKDPLKRKFIGQNARQFVLKYHNLDKLVIYLMNLYNSF